MKRTLTREEVAAKWLVFNGLNISDQNVSDYVKRFCCAETMRQIRRMLREIDAAKPAKKGGK